MQCVQEGVPFYYHQTGAKLMKNGRTYEIPREKQHEQARKAGLDYMAEKTSLDLVDFWTLILEQMGK